MYVGPPSPRGAGVLPYRFTHLKKTMVNDLEIYEWSTEETRPKIFTDLVCSANVLGLKRYMDIFNHPSHIDPSNEFSPLFPREFHSSICEGLEGCFMNVMFSAFA